MSNPQARNTALNEFWNQLDSDNEEIRRQTGVIDLQRTFDQMVGDKDYINKIMIDAQAEKERSF